METSLIIALSITVCVFIFTLFYVRWLLKTLSNIDNTITELWSDISNFNEHLKEVHDTEMFYGDTTLQALIEHSQNLSEKIESIKGFFLPEENYKYESQEEE
jgi:predicted PurR-regulated permease PerM